MTSKENQKESAPNERLVKSDATKKPIKIKDILMPKFNTAINVDPIYFASHVPCDIHNIKEAIVLD